MDFTTMDTATVKAHYEELNAVPESECYQTWLYARDAWNELQRRVRPEIALRNEIICQEREHGAPARMLAVIHDLSVSRIYEIHRHFRATQRFV